MDSDDSQMAPADELAGILLMSPEDQGRLAERMLAVLTPKERRGLQRRALRVIGLLERFNEAFQLTDDSPSPPL
jgi:hypothetical protein